MRPALFWTLTGTTALAGGLGLRRYLADRHARSLEHDLFHGLAGPGFGPAHVEGLPEPARRYLRHAIAPGTPLSPACRLWMRGTMRPDPEAAPVTLTAVETLAPRWGFVWTARGSMNGLPVRIRDHYFEHEGAVEILTAGVVPLPGGGGADAARSSRERLVAEAVWCPTALVHPSVHWDAPAPDQARFTVLVDGEAVPVTLHLDAEGSLREVSLDRWGDVDGEPWRPIPYGFRVEEERTFGGVTIPARLTGGWRYGTDAFDPARAARFDVYRMVLAPSRLRSSGRRRSAEGFRPAPASA